MNEKDSEYGASGGDLRPVFAAIMRGKSEQIKLWRVCEVVVFVARLKVSETREASR